MMIRVLFVIFTILYIASPAATEFAIVAVLLMVPAFGEYMLSLSPPRSTMTSRRRGAR